MCIKLGGGLSGSLPGDDGSFSNTWILDEYRRPVSGMISAVGFSGQNLVFRNAAKGGWKPLGPERIATSTDGHILREIDGRPALDLYKEYLGDRAKELPLVAFAKMIASLVLVATSLLFYLHHCLIGRMQSIWQSE